MEYEARVWSMKRVYRPSMKAWSMKYISEYEGLKHSGGAGSMMGLGCVMRSITERLHHNGGAEVVFIPPGSESLEGVNPVPGQAGNFPQEVFRISCLGVK